jgi:ABC-type polysaccharide/polyol phosphate transport system ATPase subunit
MIASYGDVTSLLCKGEIVKQGTPKEVTKYFKEFCKRCDHVGKLDEENLK